MKFVRNQKKQRFIHTNQGYSWIATSQEINCTIGSLDHVGELFDVEKVFDSALQLFLFVFEQFDHLPVNSKIEK